MRLLYLDWPHLPLRMEAAARPPLPELVVLGGQPWDPGTVLDCSPAARKLGVQRGQPLGSAHNLVPEAVFLPVDLVRYRDAFERALDALAAYTPSLEGGADPTQASFGQAFLGIKGLARLWGDEPILAERVATAAGSILPGRPRVGIGNTRFGAQLAAVIGARRGPGTLEAIPVGGSSIEAAWLAPLPIRLLPADHETRDRLRLFGLTRIGQFAELPRSAVLARFGDRGGELHDLARGLDGRKLRPRRPIERIRAEAELDPPVEEIEPLRFVLHHLCATLCAQLSARGSGASRSSLLLTLERGSSRRYDTPLPEPSAVPDLLERLLMARLEADPPDAPVERLALELDGTAPAAGQQLGAFTPQLARQARLDWQLAALAIRFGPMHILQARIGDPEASLPEERFAWRPAAVGSDA